MREKQSVYRSHGKRDPSITKDINYWNKRVIETAENRSGFLFFSCTVKRALFYIRGKLSQVGKLGTFYIISHCIIGVHVLIASFRV